ncbi:MAG: hypothetical protein V4714_14210 [Bacteroidota bacterium]
MYTTLFRSASTFLLVAFASTFAMAQSDESQATPQKDTTKFTRYRVISPGFSLPLLRDEAVSPLRYTGFGLLFTINSWRVKPKVLKQTFIKVGSASMFNMANANDLTLFNTEFDYTFYRKVKSYREDRLRLLAGGGGDVLLNVKLLSLNINNQLGYDFAASLKISGLLQYDFQLFKRKFTLTEQLSVPVVSMLSRPPFSWPAPYDAYEQDGNLASAVQVASFGNYFRLQNRLSLDLFPSDKRRRKAKHHIASNWRLTYEWEYMQISRPNETKLAIPALLIGRVMRF